MTNATHTQIEPVIGLEIHIQLDTRTKLWCGCGVSAAEAPANSFTCPVCLGLPGALPVMNARAVELAVRVGLALGSQIAPVAGWDRKNYFYPDQPKNYQISQYQRPLCVGGGLTFQVGETTREVRIHRAHLEDDAGKNIHAGTDSTLVDLNRAGTPLLEIVTQPDLRSAEETRAFALTLHRLVRYLGTSQANLQQGQMRFEPNVNLRIREDSQEFTTPIVEIKNLNSFRALHLAVAYEIERQTQAWHDAGPASLAGGKTNRGWDDQRQVTTPQRAKEEAHDYRYFPEPDLPLLQIDSAWVEAIRSDLPEPLAQRTERFQNEYELSLPDAQAILDCRATADLLDQAAALGGDRQTLGKHFLGIWARHANEQHTTVAALGLSANNLAELANLVHSGRINATAAARIADEILRPIDDARSSAKSLASAKLSPQQIATEMALFQTADENQVDKWVSQALAENQSAVHDALTNPKKHKAARGFLLGKAMELSGGQANPAALRNAIERQLAEHERD